MSMSMCCTLYTTHVYIYMYMYCVHIHTNVYMYIVHVSLHVHVHCMCVFDGTNVHGLECAAWRVSRTPHSGLTGDLYMCIDHANYRCTCMYIQCIQNVHMHMLQL